MLNLFCVAVILSLLALSGFSGCKRLDYCLWELRDGIAACRQHSLHRPDSRGSGQWVITSFASFKPCCSHMSLCILSPKMWSCRSRHCCCCYRTSQQPVPGEREWGSSVTHLGFFQGFFFPTQLAMSCSIQSISVKIWALTVLLCTWIKPLIPVPMSLATLCHFGPCVLIL